MNEKYIQTLKHTRDIISDVTEDGRKTLIGQTHYFTGTIEYIVQSNLKIVCRTWSLSQAIDFYNKI